MKHIIRNVISVPGQGPEMHILKENYLSLERSALEFLIEQDAELMQFVRDFWIQQGELPADYSIRDWFRAKKKDEVVDRLDTIVNLQPMNTANFRSRLHRLETEQRDAKCGALLREAAEVLKGGWETSDKRMLFGSEAVMAFLNTEFSELARGPGGVRQSGDAVHESEEAIRQYEAAERDAAFNRACMTGIDQIDNASRGIKPGELWLHAAYTGEGKSLFARNWSYNLAVYGGFSVIYVSLEMPFMQCHRSFLSIHSRHEKFISPPNDPVYPGMGEKVLPYRDIRDGSLPVERKDHFKTVAKDLDFGRTMNGNPHGSIHIWCPDRKVTPTDIRTYCENLHRAHPYHMIVVDHLGLVKADGRFTSQVDRVNSVVRDSKLLAMNFNRGESIPLLGLYQINREGKKAAEKNKGQYSLYHLSGGSEAEKSSDVVTTTYLDETLRKGDQAGISRIAFSCLKMRDNPSFEPFEALVDFTCGRMWHKAGFTIEQLSQTPMAKIEHQQATDLSQFKDEFDF